MIKLTRFFYIHWLVLPLVALGWWLDSLHTLGMAYAVVAVHELFHLFAALLVRERVGAIIVMPFGMSLRLSERVIRSGYKEIFIALAGPFANCLMLLVAHGLRKTVFADSTALLLFSFLNLTTLLLNLLPCPPLDGGRVLKALLIRRLGYISALSITRRVSRVITLILALAGTALVVLTGLNVSLLVIAAFLILYMVEEQRQNEYVVMQELLYAKEKLRKRGLMRTQSITAMDALSARTIFKRLSYDVYHVIHIVNSEQKFLRTVTEAQVVDAILQKGWHICLAEV